MQNKSSVNTGESYKKCFMENRKHAHFTDFKPFQRHYAFVWDWRKKFVESISSINSHNGSWSEGNSSSALFHFESCFYAMEKVWMEVRIGIEALKPTEKEVVSLFFNCMQLCPRFSQKEKRKRKFSALASLRTRTKEWKRISIYCPPFTFFP